MARITFSNLPSTTTPLSAANLNQITIHILSILGLNTNTWNSSTSYAVGDIVLRNDLLYRCKTAHSGAWVASNWEETTVLVDV